MRQIYYNKENIDLNYLSCYAKAFLNDEYISFVNTLTDRQLLLKGEKKLLQKLLTLLTKGVNDEDLFLCLSQLKMENQYEVLLREGIIE